jgi:predicted nucleic acid-binding protein
VILVDSSVWIDYFRGIQSSQTDRLHALLGNEPIATGDLVLAEVLQGFGSAQDFNQGKKLLTSLPIIELVGETLPSKPPTTSGHCDHLASPSEKPSTH